MTEEKKKSCGRCSHYGCLANQGMWWCNAGHTDNMDADTCVDYDDIMENAEMTTSSTLSKSDFETLANMLFNKKD